MRKIYPLCSRRLTASAYLKGCFAILLSFFSFLYLQAQDLSKIDPALSQVLAHPKTDPGKLPFSGIYQMAPIEGVATKGGPVEKRYSCIVYTTNGKALRDSGIVVNSVLPQFVTAWVTLDQLTRLSYMKEVKYISAPEFEFINNDIARANSGVELLHVGTLNNTPYKGKGVIVAIYDTGIDWKHLDFRDPDDPTKSRILRIWDQTITATGTEAPPAGFSYGVEYTKAHLDDELDGTPTNFVREADINGHGTHVAGTAAGNGVAFVGRKFAGMAPEADIVIIKGGDGSFPITNSVDAITYLQGLANTLGRPVVLNMSIGGLAGAHDGTRPHELAADIFTASGPGRVIVISAGNDNQTLVHRQVTLPASGSVPITFSVPAVTSGADLFRFRTYAYDANGLSATVTVPGGQTVTAAADQSVFGDVISSAFRVYLYNQVDPVNGHRYVEIYVARLTTGVSPGGTWTLTLNNDVAISRTFHGWINYKNSAFSAVTVAGGDNNYMVGSPGTATSAITVASYVGRHAWYSPAGNYSYTTAIQDSISLFSSMGPRRDNVLKPDVAAVGQAVVSCLSSTITPTASDVVEPGLYQKNQGTSMSAPVVTGSVALLLQANPTATYAQIKAAIANTATKDVQTEAVGITPNTVWGYGRLNVFRAASSFFNCGIPDFRTYRYDRSQLSSQDNGVTLGLEQIAVRFTPDVTGKLGGIYFHPSTTKADVIIEIRANNAGVPGAVLGTISLPTARILGFSWNYVDFTSLNIDVTNGVDYFALIKRNPSSVATWSLRRENVQVDNRSFVSLDGINWLPETQDYKIRSVVYRTAQSTAPIATITSTEARDINTSYQFYNSSCELIAKVQPAGLYPVSGNVSSKVTVHSGAQTEGNIVYVGRHYDIEPANNAATSTARVTLYFTQAEFTDFNTVSNTSSPLPTGPSDAAGIANLRVTQYHGTSTTGVPGSYTGASVLIDPADNDIVWNAERNRWEVTFDVNGFSGFFIQTLVTLPVTVEYFTGSKQANGHLLKWKVNCTGTANVKFDVERSADGQSFTRIGVVNGTQNQCLQEFSFNDAIPLTGRNYYRIKITEDNGRSYYTNVILLETNAALLSSVRPNLVSASDNIVITFGGSKGTLVIHDAAGRKVYTRTVAQGVLSIPVPMSANGVYYYNLIDENGNSDKGKILVR